MGLVRKGDELMYGARKVLQISKSRITGTHEEPLVELWEVAGFSWSPSGGTGRTGGPVRDQVGHEIAQEANQRAHVREGTGGSESYPKLRRG